MDKNKKEKIRSFGMWFSIIMAIVIFTFFSLTIKCQNVRFEKDQAKKLTDNWTVQQENGDTQTVTLPCKWNAKAGETVTYSTVLEEGSERYNSILFYTSHKYVRVLLEGKEIYTYGYDQKTPVAMPVGNGWHCIRLPEDWNGKKLQIQIVSKYKSYAGNMEVVYLGTKSMLYQQLAKKAFVWMIGGIPLLLSGIIMVASSFFFRKTKDNKKIFILGMAVLVTTVWTLLESRFMQLFTGNNLMVMNLTFLLFGLMPILYNKFFLCYEEFEKEKWLQYTYWFSIAVFLVNQILQLSGILNYLQTVTLSHLAIFFTILTFFYILFKRKKGEEKAKENIKPVFFAGVLLGLFAFIDIIRFYAIPSRESMLLFTKIGIIAFFLILGITVLEETIKMREKKLEDAIEERILRELAFVDILTGIPNRTAYEQEKERYKKEKADQFFIIMIADLNGLKYINDTLGHAEGDRAIQKVAIYLKTMFSEKGQCFRIGGDEFCVISQEPVEQFYEKIKTMEAELKGSVSCGFVQVQAKELDEGFIRADQEMYRRKTLHHASMDVSL